MEREEALKILKQHEAWRKGADIDMLHPLIISEAMDEAIRCLKESLSNETIKAWVARDKGNVIYLYLSEPYKCLPDWDSDDIWLRLNEDSFPSVKWEDEEPTEVEITIKKLWKKEEK